MTEVKLTMLFPYPTDIEKFNMDYQDHLRLMRESMHILKHKQPFTITRFADTPDEKPAYYQMFTMTFPSAENLQDIMDTPQMQAITMDAARISTGGEPVILVGVEARRK